MRQTWPRHGHSFGGHALYLKDGKLKYVYNYLGSNEQMITSNIKLPTGKCVLGVEFVKEKLQAIRNAPMPNQCIGTATLNINDQKAGEYKGMATQLGKFALCGGALKRVIVDVTGEAYLDLELEAMAIMSRD